MNKYLFSILEIDKFYGKKMRAEKGYQEYEG